MLFATLAAAVGPLFAEWSLVIAGGFCGAFLAATTVPTDTLRAASLIFARGFVMAVLFTGLAAGFAAPYLGAAADWLLFPLAGLIAWRQDRLAEIAQTLFKPRTVK